MGKPLSDPIDVYSDWVDASEHVRPEGGLSHGDYGDDNEQNEREEDDEGTYQSSHRKPKFDGKATYGELSKFQVTKSGSLLDVKKTTLIRDYRRSGKGVEIYGIWFYAGHEAFKWYMKNAESGASNRE
ncbi:23929_t:CDS:2 [Dentiscutata erythropus]|uniref:23929_t:CDS:1 n=1 Tax=Dentiscutata erythropus TaxID=1348616 RepID=A0A9N9H2N0_9GLOM|nr:23929_t:CDS:2 [Dentiscutata erythropus]